MFAQESVMEIQKQKNLYLSKLLEQEVIKQDEFEDLVFKPEINAFHSNYLSSRFMDNINFGWSAWQAAKVESHKQAALYQFEINHLAQANQQWREKAAKAQAVPEGFVLVPKEPTLKMSIAYQKNAIAPVSSLSISGYKAMIEAQEPAND